jgi:hypothetical protein
MEDQLWLSTAKELYNVQNQRRDLEKKEKELSEFLKNLSDNQERTISGMRYSFTLRPGSVDYTIVPQLKGVNLDFYRKSPIKVWKLTIETI